VENAASVPRFFCVVFDLISLLDERLAGKKIAAQVGLVRLSAVVTY